MQDYKARHWKRGRLPLRRGKESPFRSKAAAPRRSLAASPTASRADQPARGRSLLRGLIVPLAHQPGRWIYLAVVLWLFAGALYGGWKLGWGPVQTVSLSGRQQLSVEEVLRTAGLSASTTMAQVHPYEAARALAALPRVRTADVRRVYPGRVRIALQERLPVVRVARVQGPDLALDADGVVVSPDGAALPASTPLIQGVDAQAAPGEALRDPALRRGLEALAALSELGPPGPGAPVVDVSNPFLLRLTLADGRQLDVPPSQIRPALRTYRRLAARLPEVFRGRQRVDFSSLDEEGGGRVLLRPISAP
jgi:cell division septal protein FtsQ